MPAHRGLRRHGPPPPPGPHRRHPALPGDRLALRHPHLGLRRPRQPARRPGRAVRHGRGRGHRRRHRARHRGRRPHAHPPPPRPHAQQHGVREPRMIIERTIRPTSSTARTRSSRALEKITRQQGPDHLLRRPSHGHLDGSLSDGDFRRWVAAQTEVDLTAPARRGRQHRGEQPAPSTATPAEIATLFGPGIDHVPLRRRARPPRRRRDQPRRRAPQVGRHDVGRGHPGLRDRRDRHQPPRLGRARQGARRPSSRAPARTS